LWNEWRELRQQLLGHDECLRTAVGEHVLVILRGKQGIHRDRDDARLDRAEKRRGKVDRVGEREQHAMLHLEAHRLQPRAEARDPFKEAGHGTKRSSEGGIGKVGAGCWKWAS